jgi:predicted transcriptional regulator of viral defense system
MSNATLSPLEQKIYFAAKEAKDAVIFLEIIRSWEVADDNTLLFTLSNMCKKGWLKRLRKGVYLVSKPGDDSIPDPFLVSTYIFPGYNAFSSALYLHGLSDVLPFEIIVATRTESGKKELGQYSFRAVALKERHIGSMLLNNYRVSTIPKTIYDCLLSPDFCGGYQNVLKAINDAQMSQVEWSELFYYAGLFEGASFYQRLGYLLDILPKRKPEDAISICLKHVKSNIYLHGRKKGKFISKWKLIDNVGKDTLLSWWY